MKSPEQLKGYLRNLSVEKNISAQELLQVFMFERLIERISLSKYKKNLVLKGGLLVASLSGISERSTMDMDTTIVNYPMTEEAIRKMVLDIITIKIDDLIFFNFKSIIPIRKKDQYQNFSVSIEAVYEKIIVPLKIDITTGDVITPKEIEYQYKFLFSEKGVNIYTYTLETILAEKIETILSRGVINTRARDFYDIYLLYKIKKDEIKWDQLREALINTTNNRNSFDALNNSKIILNDVSQSNIVKTSWNRYQNENAYSKNVDISESIVILELMLKRIRLF